MTRDIGMWNITARSAMIDGRGTTTAAPHTNHSLDHTTTIQADLLESTPSLLDARAGVVDGASVTQRASHAARAESLFLKPSFECKALPQRGQRGTVNVSVKEAAAPAHVPLAIVATPVEAGDVSLPHRTVVDRGIDSEEAVPWMAKLASPPAGTD